ncbi:hypothetical protein [Amycolatopsis sp. cg13]|uniref:hypothetical protein n=1 Tax=Amycolatopsis sp. cg13 TaxID=3238807 RepID=UPI003523A785
MSDLDERDRREAVPEHAVAQAVDAVDRARSVLRATGDPLSAAADSALTCAISLIELQSRGKASDLDVLRGILGAARALVGEVTFAVRDRYPDAAGAAVATKALT